MVAYKVTNPSPGVWHYEYAVYNQNLDRSNTVVRGAGRIRRLDQQHRFSRPAPAARLAGRRHVQQCRIQQHALEPVTDRRHR